MKGQKWLLEVQMDKYTVAAQLAEAVESERDEMAAVEQVLSAISEGYEERARDLASQMWAASICNLRSQQND